MKLDKIIAVRTGKTVYKDGDRVIKVFENGYSKADILNEALNQARIEETGLNIPKILGVSTENGKWAIISEYIKGKTLAQLMTENPDKFDEYLERFVDIQMEIHSKKAPLLTKLKDKMNRKINQADIDATTRYDLHTRLEGMPRHASTHAAGVVISDKPIAEYVPLAVNDEAVVTQYTMTALDELGLLKMDFLGLRNLTVIADTEEKSSPILILKKYRLMIRKPIK